MNILDWLKFAARIYPSVLRRIAHSPTLLMGCYSTAKTICLCTHVWAYPSILASNYWVY
ncbi:Uncharacterised protein [Vibrio cholerae]|nr:Uncharacterised protein [Vibrio cholerae]CSC22751.1 Uncharacterised protein [Vibrio cholerae]CSC99673.1 Uncharacterised protein [Vibrio cholerae]CSI20465.1 Uncharacterised protein [Vibrio cholerae]